MNDLEFLSFKDFIERQENSKDWTIVCRSDELKSPYFDNPEDCAVVSFLAPHSDEIIQKIISHYDWRVDFYFGKVSFDIDYSTNEIFLNSGKQTIYYDPPIEVEPFTIFREFSGLFPGKAEIIQEFILYHNLYFDETNNRYIEHRTEEPVIEFGNNKQIRIKTNYIRDFLAAKKMILVTCRDHKRHLKKKLSDLTSDERIEIKKISQLHNHSVIIFDYPQEKCVCSNLFAKDILTPLATPLHPDYQLLRPDREYEDYVVGVDEATGEDIQRNCKQEGGMEFLQLAFFEKTVLDKYYGNSRIYTVEPRTIFSLHEWNLSYGVNNSGFVHVHLGDLQYIPHSEQQYWKQHNVRPQGGMSSESFKADYMAEFVESTDPIHRFKNLCTKLDNKINETFGFTMFKELIGEDQHVKTGIHSLTSNDAGEFDKQLIFLTKLAVDSINYSEIEKIVLWKPPEDQSYNKLGFLENFLIEKADMGENLAAKIVQPFRFAYELRSSAVAHRKSSKRYPKLIQKHDLEGLNHIEKLSKIVDSINTSISIILEAEFQK